MRSLYLDQKLKLREIERPEPDQNIALVKVLQAGICNTDLELVKGYMGFKGVLGHEFVGVVERSADAAWQGKRVCGEINFGCGQCRYCRSGMSRHCPERTVLGILNQNGAFADYTLIPQNNLFEIPDDISNETAVFVEPVAAALEILEQNHIEPNHKVAVIGDGKLGLLIAQVLRHTGCQLMLVGKHDAKLALAESFGIPGHKLDATLPEHEFDLVVEVSGSASGFETAMQLVKPRGTIVLKSTYHGKLELDAAPIVIDEINIVGSRCGPFAAAIRMLQSEFVDVQPLIDGKYDLENFDKAIQHAAASDSLKILFNIND